MTNDNLIDNAFDRGINEDNREEDKPNFIHKCMPLSFY